MLKRNLNCIVKKKNKVFTGGSALILYPFSGFKIFIDQKLRPEFVGDNQMTQLLVFNFLLVYNGANSNKALI